MLQTISSFATIISKKKNNVHMRINSLTPAWLETNLNTCNYTPHISDCAIYHESTIFLSYIFLCLLIWNSPLWKYVKPNH